MLESVYELATVTPRDDGRGRCTAAEWRTYCRGYYAAIAAVLEVLDLAVRRWRLALKERRRRLAEARSASLAADSAIAHDVGKLIAMGVDQVNQRADQGGHRGDWNVESVTTIRRDVETGRMNQVFPVTPEKIPTERRNVGLLCHRPQSSTRGKRPRGVAADQAVKN